VFLLKIRITAYWDMIYVKSDANVLLMSGFDNTVFPHKFTNIPIIPKPFKSEVIAKIIRESLDKAA